MTLQDVIKYHESKVEYNKRMNKMFRSMDKWQKQAQYKDVYVQGVRKYRERIKWHTEAIKVLKGVD